MTVAQPSENIPESTLQQITQENPDIKISETSHGIHFHSSNHEKLQNIRELINKKKSEIAEAEKSSEESAEEEIEDESELQVIKQTRPPISKKSEPKKAETKKPPVKKPVVPKAIKKELVDVVDYSDVYKTFLDIFSGTNKVKEFNPVTALRDAYQMFKEFQALLVSPEFEIHTKFKLSLAPLEINPRDLVNQGLEILKPSVPCDKEMYFRVVRARPEVYDIVSRSFNKKKG